MEDYDNIFTQYPKASFLVFGTFFMSTVGRRWLRQYLYRQQQAGSQGGFNSVRAQKYMGPFGDEMTRREASLILGVRESAGKDKIVAAHKRIMLSNHPDNGGSTYIATKVNEAKNVLLGNK